MRQRNQARMGRDKPKPIPTKTCPGCGGSGMDRHGEHLCPVCHGERVVPA